MSISCPVSLSRVFEAKASLGLAGSKIVVATAVVVLTCLLVQLTGCSPTGTVHIMPKPLSTLDVAEKQYREGLYAEAVASADRAEGELAASADTSGQVRALNIAGRSLVKMARYSESIRRHQKALQLARSSSNRLLEAVSLIDLGELHERQKDHEAAIEAFDSALKLLELPRDRKEACRALVQLGDIHVARGSFDNGFRSYSNALRLAQQAGDLSDSAMYQDYLGYFSRRLGDYSGAIDYHRNALSNAEKISDRTERDKAIARAHNHLGLSRLELGIVVSNAGSPDLARSEFDEAISHELAALTAAEAANDRLRQGYVLRALSAAHRRRAELASGSERDADHRVAHEFGTKALELGELMGLHEWRGLALHELAVTEARTGRLPSARARLREAIGFWTSAKDLKSLGYAHLLLAQEVHERNDNVADAIAEYRNALKVFGLLLATEDQATAWYRIGALQEKSGNLNEAEKSYLKAIEALESIRAKLTRQEHKLNFFGARLRPYEALFGLLMRRYSESKNVRFAEAAFLLSERARGQTLLDLVQGATDRFRAGVAPEVLKQEQALRARFYSAAADLANEKDDARRSALHEKIEAISLAYAEFEADVRKTSPAYAQLKNPPILSVADVATRVLRQDEILLEYFVSRDETHVFVVDSTGLRRVVALGIGQRELGVEIAKIRQPFEEVKKGVPMGALELLDIERSKRLYDKLLAPVAADIQQAGRLLIVPHGPLFYIPFEMLVTGPKAPAIKTEAMLSKFESVSYFLEVAPPIAYALSASLLNPDLADRGAPSVGARTLLAVGNPTANEDDGKPAPLTIRSRDLALAPLPQSELEVKRVANLFGRDATTFLGERATKDRFVKEAPRHRVLLLSTHGVLDEQQPMMSGIVFAPAFASREPELLQTFEIFDLALNSEFVVLSACEVGLGALREGEGILSIGRGFFYAGAASLAVTLWSVEDQASSQLVTGLFSRLTPAGADEAAALRKSKLTFLQARRAIEGGEIAMSHPFFWAPFVIIEGPRRRR